MSDYPTPTAANNPPATNLPAYRPPEQTPEPQQPASGGMSPYESPAASPMRAGGQGRDVSYGVINMLARTRGWVRFLSVLGFVGAVLLLLMGIFAIIGTGAVASAGGQGAAYQTGYMIGMGIYYVVMAFAYIYPSIKLWQYAGAISRLQASQSEMDLETALDKQRSFWKFAGIMTILLILFVVAVVVFAATAAVAVGSQL
ncbi:MAG: DUF5362 family protein [Akkermansiaceae bacterium]